MANATPRGCCRGRALILGTGLMILCGLLASGRAGAQAKTEPKGDKKTQLIPGGDVPKTGNGSKSVTVEAQVRFIDEQIYQKWRDNKIEPSAACSDEEFIRRASLDIIGRIAKPSEIAKFKTLASTDKERRAKFIDELLKSDDYAANFANIFTNLLMTRTGPKLHHEQMQVWLLDEFARKDCDWSKIVKSLLSAKGTTNGKDDQPAVNFILAHLGEQLPGDPGASGKYELVPVTSRITRLFLGLRTQCTQCHDHPFNDEWKQEHFWGINAYLRQVDAPDGRPAINAKKKGMAKDQQYRLVDNPNFNKKALVTYERRSGLIEVTKPFFLDGTKLPAGAEGARREELAKLVTKSPYFSKAFINRMWGHFFGRGFTKDVDDFGEHSPVSHPELLEKLAADWTAGGHNPRDLVRWICNSRAYSLGTVANTTNDKSDAEQFFSRMLLKAMTPEQLFESLMTATEAKDSKTADSKKKLREDWMTKLVVNFGDDEGNEGSFNGTVVQALLLMNGQEINNAIMDKDVGTVAGVMKRWDKNHKSVGAAAALKAAIGELYVAALGRLPRSTPVEMTINGKKEKVIEWQQLVDLDRIKLKAGQTHQQVMVMLNDRAFVEAYCQDLMWALLNSNEFILNH